ncbi:sulfite exporter TauE/SafE family protein [soil metagenome]
MIAFIYGSVGHGGASGYMAVLALTGYFSPELVPVILCLNILVSSAALTNYSRKGHFIWKLFWPFSVASIPAAFAGGYLQLEVDLFLLIVGAVLLLMAGTITFKTFWNFDNHELRPVNIPAALVAGAGIGFLSGLVGVGGGIFLSPLILFLGWATIRQIAAVSALFVLMNSLSGLGGHLFTTEILWTTASIFALPVLLGGYLGSRFGVKTADPKLIRLMLALVLLIAGAKMLFS